MLEFLTGPLCTVSLYIIFCTILQVGGLGDVVTSLSRAVQDLGHNVDIILPKYDCMNLSNVSFRSAVLNLYLWTQIIACIGFCLCV